MKHKRLLGMLKSHYPQVDKVVDANESMAITVEDGDVVFAGRQDLNDCVLARACMDTVGVDGALVSTATVYLIEGKTAVRYRLGTPERKQIVEFDKGGAFRTGVYTLMRPAKANRLGTKDMHKWKEGRGLRKRRKPRRVALRKMRAKES